jgi:hypothetical protein
VLRLGGAGDGNRARRWENPKRCQATAVQERRIRSEYFDSNFKFQVSAFPRQPSTRDSRFSIPSPYLRDTPTARNRMMPLGEVVSMARVGGSGPWRPPHLPSHGARGAPFSAPLCRGPPSSRRPHPAVKSGEVIFLRISKKSLRKKHGFK